MFVVVFYFYFYYFKVFLFVNKFFLSPNLLFKTVLILGLTLQVNHAMDKEPKFEGAHEIPVELIKHILEFAVESDSVMDRVRTMQLSIKPVCHLWQDLVNEMTTFLPRISDSLSKIPLQLFTNLTELDLSVNENITDEQIRLLTKLKTLNLKRNRGISSDAFESLTNLTSLNLAENHKIRDIGRLPKLIELDISGGESGRGCSMLQDTSLQNLTHLKILHLGGTPLVSDHTLRLLTGLTELYLNGYKGCSPMGLVVTAQSISCLLNLKTLDLSWSGQFGDDAIASLTNLTSLNMCCSNVTENGISHLTKLIDIKK